MGTAHNTDGTLVYCSATAELPLTKIMYTAYPGPFIGVSPGGQKNGQMGTVHKLSQSSKSGEH